jgi:hypothetical protein
VNEERHRRFNETHPVLSFRCNQELKEIIQRYGESEGFFGTNETNMNATLRFIVEEYLKYKGVLSIKYESTI